MLQLRNIIRIIYPTELGRAKMQRNGVNIAVKHMTNSEKVSFTIGMDSGKMFDIQVSDHGDSEA